jgi:hypothetical protein
LLTPSSSGAQCILQRGGIVRRLHPNCLQKIGISAPHLSSCAGPRVQFLRTVGMGDRYFFFLFFLGFFLLPFLLV